MDKNYADIVDELAERRKAAQAEEERKKELKVEAAFRRRRELMAPLMAIANQVAERHPELYRVEATSPFASYEIERRGRGVVGIAVADGGSLYLYGRNPGGYTNSTQFGVRESLEPELISRLADLVRE